MSPLLSVCEASVWERGSRTVGAKNMKKYPKDARSPIIDGRFPDRPDREHGNPLKPVRTRNDVDKKLKQCDRRWISENFPRP